MPPSRPLLLVAVGVALVVGMLALGARLGLLTSTETRYARIGAEMKASGDLVIPTLNGVPHLEKPPFTYWALAGTYAAFGVGDVAARLPSLLAGLLAVLATAAAGRRLAAARGLDPGETGRRAGLVLATTPAFVLQAFVVATDPWLVLAVTLGGLALLEADRAPGRPPRRAALGLYGAAGFGMLVKGPIALGVLLAVALATAAVRSVAERRPRLHVLRAFADPFGLALLAAIVLPWFLAAEGRMPGLLGQLLERRLVGALRSSAEFHENAWWSVWVAPGVGALPWVGALPFALRRLLRDGGWRKGPALPVLLLLLATPVLFTFSRSRLPSYSSAALPWLALAVVLGAPRDAAEARARTWRVGLRVGAVIAVAAGFAVTVAGAARGDLGLAAAACVAAPAMVALAYAAVRRPTVGSFALASSLALVAALGASAAAAPSSAGGHRALWDVVASRVGPDDPIGVAVGSDGVWGLLPFYAGRNATFFGYPTTRLTGVDPREVAPDRFRPAEDAAAWLAGPGRRWLFATRPRSDPLVASGAAFVAAEGGHHRILTNRPPNAP